MFLNTPNIFELWSGECEPPVAPLCIPAPECTAEMQKEEGCKCDCNEEPPKPCNLDIVLLIDVCSCSIDVWNGIKSYADALITKYEQVCKISAHIFQEKFFSSRKNFMV